jgi:hypothetical protein
MAISFQGILGKTFLNHDVVKKLIQELFHGVNPKKNQWSMFSYQLSISNENEIQKTKNHCLLH